MTLVLDASVMLAWCFDEETRLADNAMDYIEKQGAVVPALFFQECSNGFIMGVRRKRFDAATAHRHLEALLHMEIETDESEDSEARKSVLALALKHQLTSYDATYLALAKRRRLPLATLDAALQKAAKKEKVALFS